MTLSEVKKLLDADVLSGEDMLDTEVLSACGCDLMSDVLAFVKDQSLLLTGLLNPQSIRTAEMMDMRCVIFVRGKRPDESILEIARDFGIVVMYTSHRLYTACGLLYSNGLRGEGADSGTLKA